MGQRCPGRENGENQNHVGKRQTHLHPACGSICHLYRLARRGLPSREADRHPDTVASHRRRRGGTCPHRKPKGAERRPKDPPVVRTEHLAKQFKDSKKGVVKAVDDVSFTAEPGRIYGLLGINGAGKTTLLRLLSTVIKPDSGTAQVAGYSIETDSQKVRANIGFLSTSTALYGRLTAREMIEYFGGLYGLAGPDLKSKVDRVIEKLGIGEFSDRLCEKLSTGQKQRVSIARTILHDPPVLFFDEPTTGLDVVSSQVVMEFIEDVRDQGKTIVYCTHIMSEVERLCDHVGVIHSGRLVANGTVEQLKAAQGTATLEQAFLKLVEYQSERKTAGASA